MIDYLNPGRFIDSDAPQVAAYAQDVAGAAGSDVERILLLYVAVRDHIIYDPYVDVSDPDNFRASTVLTRGRGFCIGKAALFTAGARALGIPARVGYADVRNHLTSPRFYDYMKTDIFIWHSYADVYVGGRWVKATPAFDSALCERLNLRPLEFDATADSLLHPFDRAGRRHMEYLKDRGVFADVPFAAIQTDFRRAYPMLMQQKGLTGDFHAEAVAGADD